LAGKEESTLSLREKKTHNTENDIGFLANGERLPSHLKTSLPYTRSKKGRFIWVKSPGGKREPGQGFKPSPNFQGNVLKCGGSETFSKVMKFGNVRG